MDGGLACACSPRRRKEIDVAGWLDLEVIVREEAGAKTSIAFTVAHRPGSLYEALGAFTSAGVDLTKLESRPIPGRPWEYRFHADLRGAPLTAQLACLEELRRVTAEVQLPGSYAEERD